MQLNIFDKTKSVNEAVILPNNENSVIEGIPGLQYIKEFISSAEHDELLNSINTEKWLTDIKRRVQHYGWKYDYKSRSIDYSMYLGELPFWSMPVAQRLVGGDYLSKLPDQLIINEYLPGQGIANHVDCEPCFGDTITSISLGSACTMDFINLKTKAKVAVLLEPRSLVVVSGEARFKWTHGIAARKTDYFRGYKIERQLRVSMTFRNVIIGER